MASGKDLFGPELADLVTPAMEDPVLTGTLLTADAEVTFANLFLDILYAFLDPRIRYQ